MRSESRRLAFLVVVVLAAGLVPAVAQVPHPAKAGLHDKGVGVIRADDMKFHMQFLGSPDFKGRNMPSRSWRLRRAISRSPRNASA